MQKEKTKSIDAIGTQTEIAAKIRNKKADYVLGLKGNQGTLRSDVELYFADSEFLQKCDYYYTIEKARGGVEKREYWQTDNILWQTTKEKWAGLKSICMTKNTIYKDSKTTEETRYFISRLLTNAKDSIRKVLYNYCVYGII